MRLFSTLWFMVVTMVVLLALPHLSLSAAENDQAIMQKQVLLVAANPSVATTTGWPVGFWAAELIHPYHAFSEAGYAITIASPEGGMIVPDAWSDPDDSSGYSAHDTLSGTYLKDAAFQHRMKHTLPIGMLSPNYFDAVVVVGGQSPMFTFREAKGLQDFFEVAHRSGKITAALCHGTALLLYLTKPDGRPFVEGLRMTGFANAEEDAADQAVGQKLMPFRIEDEAQKLGADFNVGPAFQPYAIQTDNLITGQQQASGHLVAQKVIQALNQQDLSGVMP